MTRPALAACLAVLLPATALADGVRGDLGPAVRERLVALRAAHDVPALAGLVAIDGQVAGVAAVGSRRLGAPEGVTVDDLWHLGSCTKAMTATLIGRLVERELLRLDTTLGEVYPDVEMDPAWRSVTVEQLLCHRAGAPAGLERDGLWGRLFTDQETPLPSLRRTVVEHVTAVSPAPAPGTGFLYSNPGYTLAGAVAEQVTGRPYEDLLREEVFAPLGMTRAGFGAPPGDAAPRGHRRDWRGVTVMEPDAFASDNPPTIAPAGTVHAPLEDWARFALAHLRGARGEDGLLLRAETFKALHAPRGDERYALGWGSVERDWAGGRVLTHSGSNTMWFATVVVAPDAGVVALVVTNAGDPAAASACTDGVKALVALVSR